MSPLPLFSRSRATYIHGPCYLRACNLLIHPLKHNYNCRHDTEKLKKRRKISNPLGSYTWVFAVQFVSLPPTCLLTDLNLLVLVSYKTLKVFFVPFPWPDRVMKLIHPKSVSCVRHLRVCRITVSWQRSYVRSSNHQPQKEIGFLPFLQSCWNFSFSACSKNQGH